MNTVLTQYYQEISERISVSKDYIKILFKTAWMEYVKGPKKNMNYTRFAKAVSEQIATKKAEIRVKKEMETKAEDERKNTIFGRLLG